MQRLATQSRSDPLEKRTFPAEPSARQRVAVCNIPGQTVEFRLTAATDANERAGGWPDQSVCDNFRRNMTSRLPRTETLESRRLLAFSGPTPATITGEGYESVDRVLALPDGGYIAAGLFRKTQFSASGKVRSSFDESDAFVVRVGADGAVAWTKVLRSDKDNRLQMRRKSSDGRADFPSNPSRAMFPFPNGVSTQIANPSEIVSALALSAGGDQLVVGGAFQGTIDFGDGVAPLTTVDSDYYDGFVLRLSLDTGASVRAFSIGGRFNDVVTDVKVDAQDSVIVAGSFERTADFNPGKASFVVEPLGRGDGFIAKYSPRDKLVWVNKIGGDTAFTTEIESVNGIALDANGDVYATGSFAFIADFDPSSAKREIRAVDRTDSYTVKYANADGALGWVQTQGGDRLDGGRAIAVAPNGQVYSVGYFQGEAALDPNSASKFRERSDKNGKLGNRTDLFLTSFYSDGRVRWVKQLGGKNYELVAGAAVDANGNLVIAGSFTDVVDFDPSSRRVAIESPDFSDDIPDSNEGKRSRGYAAFVARYSPRGVFVDVKQVNPKFNQDLLANGMSLQSDGTALLAGRFRGGFVSPQASGIDITIETKPRGREDGYVVELL
jgi:hypothetical protein